MKYKIELKRFISKCECVVAESPAAALKMVMAAYPEFVADKVTEIVDEQTYGKIHKFVSYCAKCANPIFERDWHAYVKSKNRYECAKCAAPSKLTFRVPNS